MFESSLPCLCSVVDLSKGLKYNRDLIRVANVICHVTAAVSATYFSYLNKPIVDDSKKQSIAMKMLPQPQV